MAGETTRPDLCHVLLIGIDNYAHKNHKLYGCVNDIDKIQQLLVDRAKIPTSQITRLVSPHPTYVPDSTVPAQEATLVNIVAALSKLSSDHVGPTDRVFIYYSGHGSRREVRPSQSALPGTVSRFRESLVPVDFTPDGSNELLDFEFNTYLGNIAKRALGKVTVILDCCHSSGATRSLDLSESNSRSMDTSAENDLHGPIILSDERAGLLASTAPGGSMPESEPDGSDNTWSVDDCQVVAACLNHEKAWEVPRNLPKGEKRNGLLTLTLIEALSEIPDDELTNAAWGRFWNQVKAKIETYPDTKPQHPGLSDGYAREWLGGPPTDSDVGLWVTRQEGKTNEYVIHAGSIAKITNGAIIAVYGPDPLKFITPIGSEQDMLARVGELQVTAASREEATAIAMGGPFELPRGARGRVVQAGEAQRLSCAVIGSDDAVVQSIKAELGKSGLIEVTSDERANVRLEEQADGSWWLTDDVHGARPDHDPALVRLYPDEVVDNSRRVVEHYLRYAGPIRMAENCDDLKNALQLSLLDCRPEMMKDGRIDRADFSRLAELTKDADGSYTQQEQAGAGFCLRISNASKHSLKVYLFHCDSNGTVSNLLEEQEIGKGSSTYVWSGSNVGVAFRRPVPEDEKQWIDRIVAIGTTNLRADLAHLEETSTWPSGATRSGSSLGSTAEGPPVEQWTAVGEVLRTTAAS